MAREIQRPVRETVTPAILQMTVWAGANLASFPQASDALRMLAGVELSAKRVRRITEDVGQDRLDESRQAVSEFQEQPLMARLASPTAVAAPELGVVMMDGGRYQRRDHFGEENYDGSHWKEDKVGIVLHMHSQVHQSDPHPEFPSWLASAQVVAEIASLGSMDEEHHRFADVEPTLTSPIDDSTSSGWKEISPQLISREIIASSGTAERFGWHLEHKAWQRGVVAASRTAFVADGAAVNWTIHKQHFSQMTGVLDLMHALSYAWKAAKVLEDPAAYRRFAAWIWQGEVQKVIDELASCPSAVGPLRPEVADPHEPIQRTITYFTNQKGRMNYPAYRQNGLPLTSSHIESTIKQINLRIKGSEKFFGKETGETLLQLRADSLSDSHPLNAFWSRWQQKQTGANSYRTQLA